MVNIEKYKTITAELADRATLIAVSKTKPVEDILALYQLGQRHFGENYVQELAVKQPQLPADIHWHFIGHLQGNKVKQVAPFVYMIHGVDSLKLLQEINKQAQKLHRVITVLLQVHIAREETKFGLDEEELAKIMDKQQTALFNNVCIAGLMGMASLTADEAVIEKEFSYLAMLFRQYTQHPLPNAQFKFLSMGMSSDYAIALAAGSNMVRIGSLLFGERTG